MTSTPYALGRNVRHDPQSLAYKVQADGTTDSVLWERRTPILDQGELGSCTGNAATGWLGTMDTAALDPATLDEAFAVQLYSDATRLDSDPQNYPPHDTGSDGLSIAKVLTARGLISGYRHITSVAAAQTAIQTGAFIVGTNWYEAMFDPDASGTVRIGGKLAGGHEYLCRGYDDNADRWVFDNSWGTSWGEAGSFFMTTGTFAQLLSQQGDATVLVPADQPKPVPAPVPSSGVDPADLAAVDDWAATPHVFRKATAAAKAWPRVKLFV